ncbi:hypothetical protein [Caudoviricetes sp.]|nr:hypothetical protein [Caudoviricetes sp.]
MRKPKPFSRHPLVVFSGFLTFVITNFYSCSWQESGNYGILS